MCSVSQPSGIARHRERPGDRAGGAPLGEEQVDRPEAHHHRAPGREQDKRQALVRLRGPPAQVLGGGARRNPAVDSR